MRRVGRWIRGGRLISLDLVNWWEKAWCLDESEDEDRRAETEEIERRTDIREEENDRAYESMTGPST